MRGRSLGEITESYLPEKPLGVGRIESRRGEHFGMGDMVGQVMAPKDVQALAPGIYECHLTGQKDFCRCDEVEYLEMRGLSWVFWVDPI